MSRLRWGRMPSVTCESVNSPGELDRPGHRLSTKLSPRFSHGLIGEPLSTSRKPGLYATDCSRSASRSACSSSRGPQHDRRALPTPSGIEGFSTPPSSDPPACHDWRVKGKEALRPRARGSSSLRVPPFTRALTGRDISGERHDHSSLHCLLRHWDDRGSGATVLPRWRSRAAGLTIQSPPLISLAYTMPVAGSIATPQTNAGPRPNPLGRRDCVGGTNWPTSTGCAGSLRSRATTPLEYQEQ